MRIRCAAVKVGACCIYEDNVVVMVLQVEDTATGWEV